MEECDALHHPAVERYIYEIRMGVYNNTLEWNGHLKSLKTKFTERQYQTQIFGNATKAQKQSLHLSKTAWRSLSEMI